MKISKPNICNNCGNSCNKSWGDGLEEGYGLIDCKINGGYHSDHSTDLVQYTFSLCEVCIRQMFLQFKIKPQVKNLLYVGKSTNPEVSDSQIEYDLHLPYTWEQDNQSVEYNLWCKKGNYLKAYKNGLCNAVKDCPNPAKYSSMPNYENYNNYEEITDNSYCAEHQDRHYASNYQLIPFVPYHLKIFI